MDCLHHHDGIVHHNTDGKHKCEKSQHVDGETEQLHEEEGTDQRHRNGNGRDQGRTEILQEDIYNDEYKQEGFQQGLQNRLDGCIKKTGNIIGNVVIHTRCKAAFLDFLHALFDVLDHFTGIGPRTLLDHDGGRRTSVGH